MKTPLLYFAYNRPDHAARSLERLARSARLDEVAIRLFSDAPRSAKEVDAVEATRKVLREWAATHDATLVEREVNLGLFASIAGEVSRAVTEAGRAIVLEDDLLVSPDFVPYLLDGLDRYADDPKVLQLSGFMFPIPEAEGRDPFLIPLTTTWGWATWERAWKRFDPDPTDARHWVADPANAAALDLDLPGRPYSSMLLDRLDGKNQSWGIYWWYAVHRAGGLVLYPPVSLVANVGFDGTGAHCGDGPGFLTDDADSTADARLSFPLTLPDADRPDMGRFDAVRRFLGGTPAPRPSLLGRLRRKLAGRS